MINFSSLTDILYIQGIRNQMSKAGNQVSFSNRQLLKYIIFKNYTEQYIFHVLILFYDYLIIASVYCSTYIKEKVMPNVLIPQQQYWKKKTIQILFPENITFLRHPVTFMTPKYWNNRRINFGWVNAFKSV